MSREFGFLINGKWLKGGKKKEIKSPYNGEVAGVINIPDRETAVGSIGYAEDAFSKWRESPSHERSSILRKIAEGIAAKKKNSRKRSCSKVESPLKRQG